VDIFQALEQAKAADIRRRAEQRKAFATRQRLESQAKLQAQKLKRYVGSSFMYLLFLYIFN
jgi:hypothetical protein